MVQIPIDLDFLLLHTLQKLIANDCGVSRQIKVLTFLLWRAAKSASHCARSKTFQLVKFLPRCLKAVYYTVVVHNFNLQEKTISTVEVTTYFVKKFKAHIEKKIL